MDYLKYIEAHPEYREKLSLFMDKIERVKRTWQENFTDFLNPDEGVLLKKMCGDEGLYFGSMGGCGVYERAIAVISTEEYKGSFPIDVVRIKGNFKFEKLNHRDYLGAILSLGIRREKIGDINVFDDGAEAWLSNEIGDYICYNLTKIKHTGIKCEKILYNEAREKIQSFKELRVNISSMRLDCIAAAICQLSRSEAAALIKGGLVKVNYIIENQFSRKIEEKDLLSIKGYGRYEIDSIVNTTKSQRLNIVVKKYI